MKITAAIFVGLLLFWGILAYVIYPKEVWHYKISVTITTPEGDKTGFAVREVIRQRGLGPLPEMGASRRVRGEAVIIDLGKYGNVFALLSSSSVDAAINTFFDFLTERAIGDIVELPEEYHPVIIRYKEGRSRLALETIYQTYPRRGARLPPLIKDRFKDIYGEGVYLRKIEIVKVPLNEPVTRRINSYLPDDLNVSYTNVRRDSEWPYAFLMSDFKTGVTDDD